MTLPKISSFSPLRIDMNVKLFNNKSDKRNLIKNITEIKTVTATAKGDISVMSPLLIFNFTDMTDINYCYISELKRYYYIKNFSYLTGKRIQLNLEIDVLMSYADEIKALKVNVLRYSGIKPTYIYDGRIPLYSNTKQYIIEFPDNIFNLTEPKESDKNFLLNIAGGE